MLELILFTIIGAIAHLITKIKEESAKQRRFSLIHFFQNRWIALVTNIILSIITVIVSTEAPDSFFDITPFTAFLIGYSYNSALSNFTKTNLK